MVINADSILSQCGVMLQVYWMVESSSFLLKLSVRLV